MLASTVIAGLSTFAGARDGGQDGDDDFVSNQAIVEMNEGADINQVCADYNTTIIDSIPSERVYLLGLPVEMDEATFELMLEEDDRIECSDLNRIGEAAGGSTQSFFFNVEPAAFNSQFAWKQVGLRKAQAISTGAGVIVAVLDTGLDTRLPMLSKRIAPGGYNFVDKNNVVADVGNGIDDNADGRVDEMTGHGTYLAGIIAHMAPGCTVLPIKVLDSDGDGEAFTIARGIFHAINHGADVINLSLGTVNDNDILEMAMERAHDAGVVVVAAAGNRNQMDPVMYPSADENAIGVAAIDAADRKALFSNFGEHVTISSPGVGIVGPLPGGQFARTNGTSAATALVAGAAVLIKSRNPAISVESLRNVLMVTATNIDSLNPGLGGLMGAGRLNIAAVFANNAVQQQDVFTTWTLSASTVPTKQR